MSSRPTPTASTTTRPSATDAPGPRALPRDALGLGLRPSLVGPLCETWPELGFLEVLVENFTGRAQLPRAQLARLGARYPLVGHGVSLNLLGADPLDLEHLVRVRDLVRAHGMPYFTDHLCWTASNGTHHHDLLPAPAHPDLIPYAAERASAIQDFLGVPFGLENLSSYVTWGRDQMPEWDFLAEVVRRSGCWVMLDLNNIVVSAVNHGFDPEDYLRAIDWSRVLQVHVAGHATRADGLRHDTHDREVSDPVWDLYRTAWRLGGPFPTLLEWDEHLPSLDEVLRVLRHALEVRA